MPPLLETRGLGLQRIAFASEPVPPQKPHYLLEDLSFSVPSGGVFGIFGPSGSGKSTLLKCLCRLEEATEGEIFFHQKSIREYDPKTLRRRMTLVFQNPLLLGPTVRDDLELGFRWKTAKSDAASRGSQDQDWKRKLLAQVHLAERFWEENTKKLSAGEIQRVALARALAIQPEVLLLDEPTASLDPDSKKKIEDTIQELSQNRMTILLVSHDQRQIQSLAQHGMEIRGGKIYSTW